MDVEILQVVHICTAIIQYLLVMIHLVLVDQPLLKMVGYVSLAHLVTLLLRMLSVGHLPEDRRSKILLSKNELQQEKL